MQRYRPHVEITNTIGGNSSIVQPIVELDPNGAFVRYEEATAEIEELKAKNAMLHRAVEGHQTKVQITNRYRNRGDHSVKFEAEYDPVNGCSHMLMHFSNGRESNMDTGLFALLFELDE